MNVIRTIGWIVVTAIVVAFVSANYGEPQELRFWFGEKAPVVDWPVGVIALVFLILGLVPMWLVHRAARWQWLRRIAALEAAAKAQVLAAQHSAAQPAPPEAPQPGLTPAEPVPEAPKAEEPKA